MPIVVATSKYGLNIKILGAFVGSDEFVKADIMKHVESFETTVENFCSNYVRLMRGSMESNGNPTRIMVFHFSNIDRGHQTTKTIQRFCCVGVSFESKQEVVVNVSNDFNVFLSG